MPRLSEAKKDVISCEKLRGGANSCRSVDIRMGQPDTVKQYHSDLFGRQTRRTETSKYPEEKKTKVISKVEAIEMELAQTKYVQAYLGL